MASKDTFIIDVGVKGVREAAAELNQLLAEFQAGSAEAAAKIQQNFKQFKPELQAELRITSKGFEVAVKEVSLLEKALDQVSKKANLEGSLTGLRQQINKAKQDRDAIVQFTNQIQVGADGIARSVRVVNSEWAKQQAIVQGVGQQLQVAGGSSFWDRLRSGGVDFQGFISAGNKLTQVVTIFQALSITVSQLIAPLGALEQGLAKLQSFQLSFKAIGVGAQEAGAALQETSRIALGLGVPLNTVRDGFQRLSPVVLKSGGTLSDVSAITESLSSRFAAFGLSADSSRRVMNGVIQAFAKGKLQAEELTQQISEADPAFKVDFANALGVSVQALEEMVKNGEITTQVLIDILPELSKAELLFGKMGSSAGSAVEALRNNAVTVEQVRNQLANLNQLSLERLAQIGKPLVEAFLGIQAAITDFLSNLSKTESIKSLIGLLGNLAQSFNVALQVILKLGEGIVFLFQPILQLLNFLTQFQAVIVALGGILAVAIIAKLVAVGAAFKAAVVETAAIAAAVKAAALEYSGLGASAKKAAADVVASTAAMKTAAPGGLPIPTGRPFGPVPPPPPPIDFSAYQKAGQQVIATNAGIAASSTTTAATVTAAGRNIATSATATAAAQTTAATGFKAASQQFATSFAATAGSVTAGASRIGAGFAAAFTAARASLPALLGQFAGLAAAILPIAAAVGAVALAINTYTSIMSGANAANDRATATINQVNAALGAQAQTSQQLAFNFDSAAQKVGPLQAVIDGLRAKFRELFDSLPEWAQKLLGVSKGFADNTAVAAQYKQEIAATEEAQKRSGAAIDQLAAKYQAAKASGDQSAQGIAEQNRLYQTLSDTINGQIANLDQLIKAEQSKQLSTAEEVRLRDYLVQVYQEEKSRLEGVAESAGVVTQAYQDQTAVLDQLIAKLKEKADAEVADLNEEKEQIREESEKERERIDGLKEAEKTRYDNLKQQLATAREQSTAYYDAQLESIRRNRDAEKSAADARIRNLQALTPAERELQQVRIQELQEQAGRGGREGLEARAQLERIQANEEIARIQEEERQKEEAAQQEISRIEAERRQAEVDFKAEERRLDEEHQKNMAKLEGETRALVAEQKEKEREIDDEIKDIREGVKESIEDAGKAAKEDLAGGFSDAAGQAKNIYDLMGDIKTLASQIKIPSSQNRFAGGSVSGGGRYTVNELGKEMFLSNSGKLSWINAPAWGSWTAPGSGTVIPAHVAAGINIPRAGAQVSRSSIGPITGGGGRANFTKAMVQLVNAVNASRSSGGGDSSAAIQAAQAAQLGKLTHAVNKLVDKEWNVGVNIRAQNGGLTYAHAVNRKI